jgi:PadR family transcriptional regulator PadR
MQMRKKSPIGEFEQLVLLAILQLKKKAGAPNIARLLEEDADREVSRGALYSSLDRLEKKGLLTWEVESLEPGYRGHAKRIFEVTEIGKIALRTYRSALLNLWAGLDDVWKATRSR